MMFSKQIQHFRKSQNIRNEDNIPKAKRVNDVLKKNANMLKR